MPLEGLYWNALTGGNFDWQQPGALAWKLMMMVPEAWGPKIQMSEDKRAFYEFLGLVLARLKATI